MLAFLFPFGIFFLITTHKQTFIIMSQKISVSNKCCYVVLRYFLFIKESWKKVSQ